MSDTFDHAFEALPDWGEDVEDNFLLSTHPNWKGPYWECRQCGHPPGHRACYWCRPTGFPISNDAAGQQER